ncbi:monovalent cation/H(+) antiporter subunit G [Streptoalloteichus hindustanus]|uniref:Multisubunit sodium/proton antiporter, MrpG subunit n=1 Tax=Streptoalloteichus hindustanus TaxID=2017 RepID=A0A1M5P6Z9_STRHI|nr:monovalent cation/H(+) antiporter subunit G [Streptoalloteichus hindustanus]SHG97584.1 multisubunit sodium/proton antiporter, MrpG subunit [Streptoalloteichus hindustanus]
MTSVSDVVTSVFLLAGASSCLWGAVGLVRFPDTPARLHAAAKPQSFGLLMILVGTALRVTPGQAAPLVLVALVQFVTAPVIAQVVGRAAHHGDAISKDNLVLDELRQPGERRPSDRQPVDRGPDAGRGDGPRSP